MHHIEDRKIRRRTKKGQSHWRGGTQLEEVHPQPNTVTPPSHGTPGPLMRCRNCLTLTRKENFRPIDGESLLSKIRAMSITEWNYKNADPSIKYVGPVAQEFYAAFHLGGTDSLGINSISIDGVNMAAIQALEKRTTELREKNAQLDATSAELHAKAAELEMVRAQVEQLEARLAHLEEVLEGQKSLAEER